MFKIKHLLFISIFILGSNNLKAQSKIIPVDNFDKVVVSPHIEVTFIEGSTTSVTVESISVNEEKLNIEVKGKTLQIYLDDAKTYTKSEKKGKDEYNYKQSIYSGTIVKAIVTYQNLEELSLRGEENFKCISPIEVNDFVLTIYGESEVFFKEVIFNNLNTTIYGESILNIKSGNIGYHKMTSYGESVINSLDVVTNDAKVTAYGEGIVRLNVLEDIKITAYGEAEILYKGNPTISKGIVIGECTIKRIEE